MPEASVIVLSFNSLPHLATCLDGLQRQTMTDREIIVVDNASIDGSPDLVHTRYPDVRLLRRTQNTGYASGCNLGFQHASGRVLAVIGPDCEPEPEWLEALCRACRRPGVGLATSMVALHNQPELINACGNDLHLLGLGFCRGLNDPRQMHVQPTTVASISGCSFAMPRSAFQQLGGFDEAFFMYCEDTDLSLRAWLAGYRVMYVPNSVTYHRYRVDVRPAKFYQLERNRYLVLLKNLRWLTLGSLLPGLIVGELLMWIYAVARGPAFWIEKVRAWRWIVAHWSWIRDRRQAMSTMRHSDDRQILLLMSPSLPEHQIVGEGRIGRLLGCLARAYFSAVLVLARMVAGLVQGQTSDQSLESPIELAQGAIEVEDHDTEEEDAAYHDQVEKTRHGERRDYGPQAIRE